MTLQFVGDYLDKKIKSDPYYIVCTYFDLRVRNNLSEGEIFEFLNLSRNKLENMGYKIYFRGSKYTYNNTTKIVKDNELLVAVKGE